MGATKLPAAPALETIHVSPFLLEFNQRFLHDEVNGAKLFHASFSGLDQVVGLFFVSTQTGYTMSRTYVL